MKLKSTPKFSFCIRPKIFFALLILIWTELIFAQLHNDSVSLGRIKIVITGFENNDGDCWFAIDNSKEVYEREDSVWIGKILSIKNNEVIVVIDSLKYGEYAVKVFHDENKNGELDTDFLGIPDEDYGYSNDASGWFGPPSWEKAKFIFNQPELTIRIEVD
jgi:uncharacterized protein (DUF2141 family)